MQRRYGLHTLFARGNTAFVYGGAKKPARLDMAFNNEASWSGSKQ